MEPSDVVRALKAAREKITDPDCWQASPTASDKHGIGCRRDSTEAVRWNWIGVTGAIGVDPHPETRDLGFAIFNAVTVGFEQIIGFTDEPHAYDWAHERVLTLTHAQTLAIFDRAILLASACAEDGLILRRLTTDREHPMKGHEWYTVAVAATEPHPMLLAAA